MAIAGLGTDLVELARIEKALSRFEERLLAHILHPAEQRLMPCSGKARTAFAASRFAVKEAAAKALCTGFASGVVPTDIETASLPSGAPILRLHGAALSRAKALGVCACHLSITHSATHAMAVVILESNAVLQDELIEDMESTAELNDE